MLHPLNQVRPRDRDGRQAAAGAELPGEEVEEADRLRGRRDDRTGAGGSATGAGRGPQGGGGGRDGGHPTASTGHQAGQRDRGRGPELHCRARLKNRPKIA
jgi:hypothetical protein